MMSCAPLQLPHTFVRAVKPAFEDGDSQVFLAFPCDQLKPKSKFLRFFGWGVGSWGWALYENFSYQYAHAHE